MRTRQLHAPLILLTLLICAAAEFCSRPVHAGLDADQARLRKMRTERRAGIRARSLDKATGGAPASFTLLVIPVDFADQRFGLDFDRADLGQRLAGESSTSLVSYFKTASSERLDLQIVIAPSVHLAGPRADYSDIGWNGFFHTRALAREALTAVAAMGLDFARFDNDGPDGVPGSGDDDGRVDGVLILHAGPGQENDPVEGLVQPLQFFLAEPVVDHGVAADFYAVAAARSGLGIWAHETGHLMGMEDRYDPLLAPGGEAEVVSRGGLGDFSLMASGAWGTGGGQGPALPDAYTLCQLGWADPLVLTPYTDGPVTLTPVTAGGRPGLLELRAYGSTEYFLLEARDPVVSAPLDAGLPGRGLLVYHVDEGISEGQVEPGPPADWRLRVMVVEADGDLALARGEDGGAASDVFPGSMGIGDLPAFGYPGLSGYEGGGGFSLTGITSLQDGSVRFTVVPDDDAGVMMGFDIDPETGRVDLAVHAAGRVLENLTCEISLDSEQWGTFTGGAPVTIPFTPVGGGAYVPTTDLTWEASPVQPGAKTVFTFTFDDDLGLHQNLARRHLWATGDSVLVFPENWPAGWEVRNFSDTAASSWWRWNDPSPSGDGAILAFTADAFADGTGWPDVVYDNFAHARFVTPPVGGDVIAVRLVHAIESEILDGNVAMDGGRAVWISEGGEITAEPVGGYRHRLSPRAFNPLQSQGVFAADTLSLRDGDIVWQVDVVTKPDNGSWRLGLEFASNGLWRRKGWFIKALEPVYRSDQPVPFQARWEGDREQERLTWTWPWPDAPPDEVILQGRDPLSGQWVDLGGPMEGASQGLALSAVLENAGDDAGLLRILALGPPGWVATPAVAVVSAAPGADGSWLGFPWPNPGPAPLRVELFREAPPGARLGVYDLRGRFMASVPTGPGLSILTWNGRDQRGYGVPAGLYFLRLEGVSAPVTRKVMLLR